MSPPQGSDQNLIHSTPQPAGAWCPLCGTEGDFYPDFAARGPHCPNPECDVRTFRFSSFTKTPPGRRVDVWALVVNRSVPQ